LQIGSVLLETPVLAAPIAGFSDVNFRAIVRRFGGCGLLFTEMVSAGGWIDGRMAPERLRGIEREPRPLGVQLWDRDAEKIGEAARRLSDLGVSVIDLNFGCPKKRIMGKHAAGATLLRDPATVGRLVAAAVRGAGGVPVTAKIRLGPRPQTATAPAVARCAEDNGAAAVTVHGRFGEQHYGFPCHYDLIAQVVDSVAIPVIANGDVRDVPSALQTLQRTAAAGVMVAREALTRPWVFREISAALRGATLPPPPTPAQRRDVLLDHHAALVENEGEEWGTVLMRKFAARYLSGLPGARPTRDALVRTKSAAEFRSIVHGYFADDDTARARGEATELSAAGCGN
jgi:tRNA-dihydrouridine synthase B